MHSKVDNGKTGGVGHFFKFGNPKQGMVRITGSSVVFFFFASFSYFSLRTQYPFCFFSSTKKEEPVETEFRSSPFCCSCLTLGAFAGWIATQALRDCVLGIFLGNFTYLSNVQCKRKSQSQI